MYLIWYWCCCWYLPTLFVVSEFAIVKIRRTKLEELAHFGNKRAETALKITENLNTYLSAIQLGITLASLGLGWIGEPAVSKLLEDLFGNFLPAIPSCCTRSASAPRSALLPCCTSCSESWFRSRWLFRIPKIMRC